jgi:hypothetical protein
MTDSVRSCSAAAAAASAAFVQGGPSMGNLRRRRHLTVSGENKATNLHTGRYHAIFSLRGLV